MYGFGFLSASFFVWRSLVLKGSCPLSLFRFSKFGPLFSWARFCSFLSSPVRTNPECPLTPLSVPCSLFSVLPTEKTGWPIFQFDNFLFSLSFPLNISIEFWVYIFFFLFFGPEISVLVLFNIPVFVNTPFFSCKYILYLWNIIMIVGILSKK